MDARLCWIFTEIMPHHVGSGDSEIPLANAGETNVSDRLFQCQTFSEIASG